MAGKYPKIVAFDLDGTVWSNWLNPELVGRNGRVGKSLEDNLGIYQEHSIVEKKDWVTLVKVSDHLQKIIAHLVLQGVTIAIASMNSNRALCDRAMWLINLRWAPTYNKAPFTNIIKYREIYNSSNTKQTHFERIKQWSNVEYRDMLFFDDQARNSDVELWKGVTYHRVANGTCGITWDDFMAGWLMWLRNQSIVIKPIVGPNPFPNRKLVGYVGTDWATAEIYRRGGRRPRSTRPSRWGWGIYVSDDAAVASVFAKWQRENNPNNQYICKVFARDWTEFFRLDKVKIDNMNFMISVYNAQVWVPESGSIPQTDNMHNTDAQIAEVQLRRDELISKAYSVKKPYIIFARHLWMDMLDGIPWRQRRKRFSEMVLYPQLQDALFCFEVYRLSDVQSRIDNGRFDPCNYRRSLTTGNIRRNNETLWDFHNNQEQWS